MWEGIVEKVSAQDALCLVSAYVNQRDVLIRHYQSCPAVKDDASVPENVPRRVTRACKTCNELRLKCSGGPVCTRCVELGRECIFRQRARRTRKEHDTLLWHPASSPPDVSNEGLDLSKQHSNKFLSEALIVSPRISR